MNEYELIRRLAGRFPRCEAQENGLFGCDAEIVNIGGQRWGMTIDEFTPEEDRFSAEDPVRLGWNLAAATLSDLLAAGVAPQFFLSALSLPRAVDPRMADGVAAGVAAVLAEAGCAHCGGDLGTADPWRFTGFAMGPLAAPRPLLHCVPSEPQALCLTGTAGDLNLAAFRNSSTPLIELRLAEAALARKYGTACIDTSGGFLDALWILHEQSPNLRFAVDSAAIPVAPEARAFAAQAGVPLEAVLIGGAGEYELLFTVPAAVLDQARPELAAAGISVVGSVAPGAAGVVWQAGGVNRPVCGPPPCPRAAASAEEHARAAIRMAEGLRA